MLDKRSLCVQFHLARVRADDGVPKNLVLEERYTSFCSPRKKLICNHVQFGLLPASIAYNVKLGFVEMKTIATNTHEFRCLKCFVIQYVISRLHYVVNFLAS